MANERVQSKVGKRHESGVRALLGLAHDIEMRVRHKDEPADILLMIEKKINFLRKPGRYVTVDWWSTSKGNKEPVKESYKRIAGLGPYVWACSCGINHSSEKDAKNCSHDDKDYDEVVEDEV